MDRIDAMQAFARVVETGSFTKAAETLQTNKTRVTQLIQQLETRLRVKLLHRTTRKAPHCRVDLAEHWQENGKSRLLARLPDIVAGIESFGAKLPALVTEGTRSWSASADSTKPKNGNARSGKTGGASRNLPGKAKNSWTPSFVTGPKSRRDRNPSSAWNRTSLA